MLERVEPPFQIDGDRVWAGPTILETLASVPLPATNQKKEG